MSFVEARGLTKRFHSGQSGLGLRATSEVLAVDGVSLIIETGETLGLVGESGSGKSTLGRLLLRLAEPDAGEVIFDGHDVLRARGGELRRLRRDMGIIFQDPFGSLDPRMTVAQIVGEPIAIHGGANRSQRVMETLGAVGLDASVLQRYPHEFSGGQRQRISIARALVMRPRFIVADEPVSALDVSVSSQTVNLLRRLQREFALTYLFISHSMPIVHYLADRIAVMQGGKLVEVGTTEQITTAPQHPYTRALLEATPEMEASTR
jgi:peptide/nickel transport system ATP-binding protein